MGEAEGQRCLSQHPRRGATAKGCWTCSCEGTAWDQPRFRSSGFHQMHHQRRPVERRTCAGYKEPVHGARRGLADGPPPMKLHPAQTSAPLCQQESKSQKTVCPNSGTGLSRPGPLGGAHTEVHSWWRTELCPDRMKVGNLNSPEPQTGSTVAVTTEDHFPQMSSGVRSSTLVRACGHARTCGGAPGGPAGVLDRVQQMGGSFKRRGAVLTFDPGAVIDACGAATGSALTVGAWPQRPVGGS